MKLHVLSLLGAIALFAAAITNGQSTTITSAPAFTGGTVTPPGSTLGGPMAVSSTSNVLWQLTTETAPRILARNATNLLPIASQLVTLALTGGGTSYQCYDLFAPGDGFVYGFCRRSDSVDSLFIFNDAVGDPMTPTVGDRLHEVPLDGSGSLPSTADGGVSAHVTSDSHIYIITTTTKLSIWHAVFDGTNAPTTWTETPTICEAVTDDFVYMDVSTDASTLAVACSEATNVRDTTLLVYDLAETTGIVATDPRLTFSVTCDMAKGPNCVQDIQLSNNANALLFAPTFAGDSSSFVYAVLITDLSTVNVIGWDVTPSSNGNLGLFPQPTLNSAVAETYSNRYLSSNRERRLRLNDFPDGSGFTIIVLDGVSGEAPFAAWDRDPVSGLLVAAQSRTTSLPEAFGWMTISPDSLSIYASNPPFSPDTAVYTRNPVTEAPTLSSPSTMDFTSPTSVDYTLAERMSSVTITFTPAMGDAIVFTADSDAARAPGTFSDTVPSANWVVSGGTFNNAVEYSIVLAAVDAFSSPESSTAPIAATTDLVTETPTLSAPAMDITTVTPSVSIEFTLPEAFSSASFILTNSMGVDTFLTIDTAGENVPTMFTLNAGNISPSSTGGVIAETTTLPADTYTLTLQYSDALGNPAVNATNTPSVALDGISLAPTTANINNVLDPATGVDPFSLTFQLAEAANSVSIVFEPTSGMTVTVDLAGTAFMTAVDNAVTISFSYSDPAASADVTSVTNSFVSGTSYTVTVAAVDDLMNSPAGELIASPDPLLIDFETAPGTVNSPTASPTTLTFNVDITLGETAGTSLGSVNITFAADPMMGGDDYTLLLDPTLYGTQTDNIIVPIDPTDLMLGAASYSVVINDGPIETVTELPLPQISYSISLTYRDALSNPPSTSASVGPFLIDTYTIALQDSQWTAPDDALVVDASSGSTLLPLAYIIPEAPELGPNSAITISNGVDVDVELRILRAGSPSLELDVKALASNDDLSLFSGPTLLPDGQYSISIQYEDTAPSTNVFPTDNTATEPSTLPMRSFTIDTVTLDPTLTLNGGTAAIVVNNMIQVQYEVPETANGDGILLTFTDDETTEEYILTLDPARVGASEMFTWNTDTNPATLDQVVSFSEGEGSFSLPDGTYSVVLTYADQFNNPNASSAVVSARVDRATLPATLSSPDSDTIAATSTQPLFVNFTIPETPDANTVFVTLDDQSSPAITLDVNPMLAVAGVPIEISIDLDNTANSTPMNSITTSTNIPDGTYSVSVTYTDDSTINGPAESNVATNVRVDTVAIPLDPIVNPIGTSYRLVPVEFDLPETASAVNLLFVGSQSINIALTATMGTVNFTLDPANPSSDTDNVQSGQPAVPDDIYRFEVNYTDEAGNPSAVERVFGVTVDTVTLTPTLTAPAAGSTIDSAGLEISFALGEDYLADSLKIDFREAALPAGTGASVLELTLINTYVDVQDPQTFSWSPLSPAAPADVQSISPDIPRLPDGTYDVVLTYQDFLGNPAADFISAAVVVDTVTLAPTIISPSADSVSSSPLNVTVLIPETPAPGSDVVLTFNSTSGGSEFVLRLSDQEAFVNGNVNTFSWDLSGDPPAANVLEITPSVPAGGVPSDTYMVTLSYMDQFNVEEDATPVMFTVDRVAQPADLTSPAAGLETNEITISYTLPEAPEPGSVQVTFSGPVDVTFGFDDSLSNSVPIADLSNLMTGGAIESVSAGALPDGTYSVSITYSDAVGNEAMATTNANVRIDTTINAPALTSPDTGAFGETMQIAYTLPEMPRAGTVTLTFVGSNGRDVLTLTMSDATSVSEIWTLDQDPVTTLANVVSLNGPDTLPDDTYSVELSYEDAVGNGPAQDVNTGIVTDQSADPPTLLAPVSNALLTTTLNIDYRLPDTPTAGSVLLSVVGSRNNVTLIMEDRLSATFSWQVTDSVNTIEEILRPATGSDLRITNNGLYDVSVSYIDLANHPRSAASAFNVLIDRQGRAIQRISLAFRGFSDQDCTETLRVATEIVTALAEALDTDVRQLRVVAPGPCISISASNERQINVQFDVLPDVEDTFINEATLIQLLSSSVADSNSTVRQSLSSTLGSVRLTSQSILPEQVCVDANQQPISCPVSDDNSDDVTRFIIIGVVVALAVIGIIVGVALHSIDRRNKRAAKNDQMLQMDTKSRRFEDFDTNHDGVITREEFEQGMRNTSSADVLAPSSTGTAGSLQGMDTWSPVSPYADASADAGASNDNNNDGADASNDNNDGADASNTDADASKTDLPPPPPPDAE